MANYFNNGQVVYVEPNIASDFTSYNSTNMGQVHKSVDLEDMSVVVGLEVEVKGREYDYNGNDGTVIRMNWRSGEKGEEVSFMQGTKISTVNKGEIKSLTTNYTDIHLFDLQKDGTMEMFGIKSVDISYNNFMVPEVEIQFVDVRGVSLFAQEEMRHNLTNGNIDACANNGIDGSFFKCFFTFPYPKFTLYVKGFYGETASYDLTCSDFRAAFDSNTGNFNVRATFVGYAFSFLNDIMVTGLVSAPYSDYVGKDYWERETKKRFRLNASKEWKDSNQADKDGKVAIPKLGYICTMYREVQKRVADEIQQTGYADIAAQEGFKEDQVEILREDNISDLRTEYQNLMERLRVYEEEYHKANQANNNDDKDTFISVPGFNDCCIITDNDEEDLDELINKFESFNEKLRKTEHVQVIKSWVGGHTFLLGKEDSIGDVINEGNRIVKSDIVNSERLRNAIQQVVDDDRNAEGDKKDELWNAWFNWDNSKVYVYQDFDLKDILGLHVDVEVDNSEQVTYLKQKIEQYIIKKTFNKVFGFEPSVENITKIIMAHVETWVHMVSECASRIENMGQNRSVENLKIPLDSLPDTGPNTAIGIENSTIVWPFPKITRFIEKDGVKKQEDEWIGAINGINTDYIEEIKLVEGLLNGAAKAAHDIEKANPNSQYNEEKLAQSGMLYPLSFFDFFIGREVEDNGNITKRGDCVWGKNLKLNDVNDLFARFCVRAFALMSTQGKILTPKIDIVSTIAFGIAAGVITPVEPTKRLPADVCGRMDAENFLDYVERNGHTSELSTLGKVVQGLTSQQVWEFLTGSDTTTLIDKTKKNLPWGKTNQPLIQKTTLAGATRCELSFGRYSHNNNNTYSVGHVFPIRNWTFKEWDDLINKDGKPINFSYHNSYIVSLSDEYGRDTKAMLLEYIVGNTSYFTNSLQYLNNSNYSDYLSRIFGQPIDDFNFTGLNEGYFYHPGRRNELGRDSGRVHFFVKGDIATYVDSEDAVGYENGNVTAFAEGSALDLYDFFWRNEFMQKPDGTLKTDIERATDFINTVFLEESVDSPNFEEGPWVMHKPLFALAKDVLDFYNGEISARLAIKKKYLDLGLNKFMKTFRKIEDDFGLGLSLDEIKELKSKLKEKLGKTKDSNIKDDNAKKIFLEFYKEKGKLDKWEQINNIYKIKAKKFTYEDARPGYGQEKDDYGGVMLIPNVTKEMRALIREMFKIVSVCTTSKFNGEHSQETADTTSLDKSDITGYFDGFIEILKEKITVTDDTVQQDSLSLNTDPNDIKVGVYNYIKLLYDKWIATGNQNEFYKMETLFDDMVVPTYEDEDNKSYNDPTFQFIDSMYNKIGNTMYINLSTLVERIYQSQTRNGYTLLSLLSALYADNKFLFLCIQNFQDLSRDDAMVKMFQPISFIDVENVNSRPNFIVLMPYEASSKLDVKGAAYPDDGFYLNDETTYPEMIRQKNSNNGFSIPAFGVCYGQQYQNYFKDIQVDMSAPMVTEQSIKAKFMIANASDGSDNNGMKLVTAGQDLYTIYANNSYTCTVTMMGCAWVQPMMYFVLQNVPMFRGSYMIVKVNHQITPGNMVTTFKGVRMAKTVTRSVEDYLMGSTIDSYNGGGENISFNAERVSEAYYASNNNTCDYAYYSPVGVEIMNPTYTDLAAYCYLTYTRLRDECGIDDGTAKGICAAFCGECNFRPYVISIDGNPRSGFHVGGGLAGFFHCNKADDSRLAKLYKFTGRNVDELNALDEKCLKVYQSVVGQITAANYESNYLKPEILANRGIIFPIGYEEQMAYLIHCINDRNEPISAIKNITNPVEACRFWVKVFGLGNSPDYDFSKLNKRYDRWFLKGRFGPKGPTIGEWVTQSIENKTKFQSQTNINAKTDDKILEIARNLTHSFKKTLDATQKYLGVTVKLLSGTIASTIRRPNGETERLTYYRYTAVGANNTNLNDVLFDVILNTYDGWFDRIKWDVGSGGLNSKPLQILVHVVDKKPTQHQIMISNNQLPNCQILLESELHENLKKSCFKYCIKNNITKPGAIQSLFTACARIQPDKIEEIFKSYKSEQTEKISKTNRNIEI